MLNDALQEFVNSYWQR